MDCPICGARCTPQDCRDGDLKFLEWDCSAGCGNTIEAVTKIRTDVPFLAIPVPKRVVWDYELKLYREVRAGDVVTAPVGYVNIRNAAVIDGVQHYMECEGDYAAEVSFFVAGTR